MMMKISQPPFTPSRELFLWARWGTKKKAETVDMNSFPVWCLWYPCPHPSTDGALRVQLRSCYSEWTGVCPLIPIHITNSSTKTVSPFPVPLPDLYMTSHQRKRTGNGKVRNYARNSFAIINKKSGLVKKSNVRRYPRLVNSTDYKRFEVVVSGYVSSQWILHNQYITGLTSWPSKLVIFFFRVRQCSPSGCRVLALRRWPVYRPNASWERSVCTPCVWILVLDFSYPLDSLPGGHLLPSILGRGQTGGWRSTLSTYRRGVPTWYRCPSSTHKKACLDPFSDVSHSHPCSIIWYAYSYDDDWFSPFLVPPPSCPLQLECEWP